MADRSLIASVVPEVLADAPGPKRRSKKEPQLVQTSSGNWQIRTLERPEGYSRINGMTIAPWVPIPHNPSVLKAIRTLQSQGCYVPESNTRSDGFSALLEEGWVDFQRLEGRLCSRLKRPIEGTPGARKFVCRCCWFWTDQSKMCSILVGADEGSLHRVEVCSDCINEGAIPRTTHQGYLCARWQNPRTDR